MVSREEAVIRCLTANGETFVSRGMNLNRDSSLVAIRPAKKISYLVELAERLSQAAIDEIVSSFDDNLSALREHLRRQGVTDRSWLFRILFFVDAENYESAKALVCERSDVTVHCIEDAEASEAWPARVRTKDILFEDSGALWDEREVEYLSPSLLWLPNRLDIGVKILLAKSYLGETEYLDFDVADFYREQILWYAGRELGQTGRIDIKSCEKSFFSLIDSIRENGLREDLAIFIDCHGRLVDGAHRIAAAIALGLRKVPVRRLPGIHKVPILGMRWFLHNGFSPVHINLLLRTWISRQRSNLVIFECADGLFPEKLMADLEQQFQVVAWRDLAPERVISGPQSISVIEELEYLPCKPLRYVLLKTDESRTLHKFGELVNAMHYGNVNCQILSYQAAVQWGASLFDEHFIAALHPNKESSDSGLRDCISRWIQYGEESATDGAFKKWRNLELLKDVQTIIDVGVAYGTPDLYRNLKPRHVVFLEPVKLFSEHIESLRKQFSSSQYLPFGLASQDGEATIHYREDGPRTTSLLKSSALRDTGTEVITELPVKLRRLDSIFADLRGTNEVTLLKIDTEGYELEVLRGAVESLKRIKYLMLELSVIERFENSYHCHELVTFLQQHEFALYTCLSASFDSKGYCRLIDAVFVNKRLLS